MDVITIPSSEFRLVQFGFELCGSGETQFLYINRNDDTDSAVSITLWRTEKGVLFDYSRAYGSTKRCRAQLQDVIFCDKIVPKNIEILYYLNILFGWKKDIKHSFSVNTEFSFEAYLQGCGFELHRKTNDAKEYTKNNVLVRVWHLSECLFDYEVQNRKGNVPETIVSMAPLPPNREIAEYVAYLFDWSPSNENNLLQIIAR